MINNGRCSTHSSAQIYYPVPLIAYSTTFVSDGIIDFEMIIEMLNHTWRTNSYVQNINYEFCPPSPLPHTYLTSCGCELKSACWQRLGVILIGWQRWSSYTWAKPPKTLKSGKGRRAKYKRSQEKASHSFSFFHDKVLKNWVRLHPPFWQNYLKDAQFLILFYAFLSSLHQSSAVASMSS